MNDSAVGNGKIVGLGVSDARTDKKLGEVGDPNTKMVDVSVEEDPSAAVYERLQAALTKLGFSVAPYSDAMESTLQVEIRSLVLKSVKTAFTFETELRAQVLATPATAQFLRPPVPRSARAKTGLRHPSKRQHHAVNTADFQLSKTSVRRAIAGTARQIDSNPKN